MKTKNKSGKNLSLYLIPVFLFILLSYGAWYFFFNIYEVKYRINFIKTLPGGERLYEIENIPLNSLGKKAPARKLNFDFEIKEGENLITILPRNNNKELYFKSAMKDGEVIFILKTELSLFPQKIEFDLAGK